MRLKPGSLLALDLRLIAYPVRTPLWSIPRIRNPDLAALEEGGYVVSADEPRGRRPRTVSARRSCPSRKAHPGAFP